MKAGKEKEMSLTGGGLWIPKGYSFANKSVLLSKNQIVNILVYEYLNLK